MTKDVFQRRRGRVQVRLRRLKLDGLLVTNVTNVRYLSGFTGDSSWLVVGRGEGERGGREDGRTGGREEGVRGRGGEGGTGGREEGRGAGATLITDSRFAEQAHDECAGCAVVVRKGPLHAVCGRVVRAMGLRRVGFEGRGLVYEEWSRLQDGGVTVWVPTAGLVEELRMVKDADEVAAIVRAIRVAEECFRRVRVMVRPGVSEAGVANEIECVLRRLGAAGSSFETIVLFGERGSLPHGRPSGRVLRAGEPVLVDWGARVGLYNSDLTRVLVPSTMSARFERVYRTVLAAQAAALRGARPGMRACVLDGVARGRIAGARLGSRFGHGLGHGVGMEIHEGPAVSALSKDTLRPGMVFTVEPGVYVPGWGGVRIEDMVLLTRSGPRVLTGLPREMGVSY